MPWLLSSVRHRPRYGLWSVGGHMWVTSRCIASLFVGGSVMVIIDAQVHAYERDHPGRPWAGVLTGPAEVTGDDMVAAMDAVGVDGAVLVSPFTMYGYDASYALEVHRQHPDRFGLVKPVDATDPGGAETIAAWAAIPGTVGIRLMMNR